jgi:phosphatidylglycerophosphate synthase
LLDGLRRAGWTPRAWAEFLTLAAGRSLVQARLRPRALVEATALHLAIAVLADRRGRLWAAASWAMTASHLGLLEERKGLGLPNLITLLRANLPALDHTVGRVLPALALASDLLDGKLARATANETLFGKHADFLADTAFWTWFTVRHEASGRAQALTFLAWAAPVAILAAASFSQGRLVEIPRSRWLRPSAAVEIVLGVRLLLRSFGRT